MARFRITPLAGEPFVVEADSAGEARRKGHEQMRGEKRSGTVIWRCDELTRTGESA